MKKIIWFFPILFLISCSKEVLQPKEFKETVVTLVMQHDIDNMPINYAWNCFKGDSAYSYDSNVYYGTAKPDTLALRHYSRLDSHYKTGRVDSSFVQFGVQFNIIGEIEHREYTFTAKIKKIVYGTN